MAQRIHVARSPEDEALAAAFGVRPPVGVPGRVVVWHADERPAGAASVSLRGGAARIEPVAGGATGDHRVGGLVATLKVALRAATALGGAAPERIEVRADGVAGVLAGLGFQPGDDGMFVGALDTLSSSFVESPEEGRLGEAAERRVYARGETIFGLGAPARQLAVVERGSVRLVGVDRRGQSNEVALLGPGALAGEATLVGRLQYDTHAVAHATEVDLVTIDREALALRLDGEPSTHAWLHGLLVDRIHSLTGRVLNGEDPAVTARIARVLAGYGHRARRMGRPGTPACHLRWLAEQVGVSPVRARTMVTEMWEHTSLLREEVLVHDPAGLDAWAGLHGGWRPPLAAAS